MSTLKRQAVFSTAVADDDVLIDIVIPIIERDLATLPLVLAGVRRNVAHVIGSVFLVGPPTTAIISAAQSLDCRFLAEDSVLPIKRREFLFQPTGIDRSGWVFQQLLKLSADTFCENDNFLIMDADTVLIRRQAFLAQGRPIFRISDELHLPYFENMRRLLGHKVVARFSYVAHHMLFQRAALVALRTHIERVSGESWSTAILNSLDRHQLSSFSEYETYGSLAGTCQPRPLLEYWNNLALAEMPDTLEELERRYAARYSTVSVHWYLAGRT